MAPDETHPERAGLFGWILNHPKLSISIFVLLFLGVGIFVADRAFANRFAAKVGAIRARGEPTCIDDLNATSHRLTDSENVLPGILAEVAKATAKKIPEEVNKNLLIEGLGVSPPTGCRWPDEQREAAHQYLDLIKDETGRIHELLGKGRCEYVLTWKSPIFNMLFPELSQIRHAFKTLCLEAQLSANDGNCKRASQVLQDVFAMADWGGVNPWVITCLTDMACDALLQASISEVINQCFIEAADLQSLQQKLEGIENGPDMKRAFLIERVLFIDAALWIRRNGQMPQIWTNVRSSIPTLPVLTSLDVAEGLEGYNRLVRALDKADIDSIKRVNKLDPRTDLPSYCVFSRMMVPGLNRAVVMWANYVAENRCLQVSLAAERFRSARGRWPAGLDELVPAFLKSVPIDPFDGKPVRFATWSDGIKVWSIGEDLFDNGGDVGRIELRRNKRPVDSGWVVLNPQLRGRAAPLATTQHSSP